MTTTDDCAIQVQHNIPRHLVRLVCLVDGRRYAYTLSPDQARSIGQALIDSAYIAEGGREVA